MILMFPVTQGTLHLIRKLSMVFLRLQAGRFSWDISKKWPPKALSVPRTTSNWFLFLGSFRGVIIKNNNGNRQRTDPLISIGTAVSSCKRKKSSWKDYNVLNSSVQLDGASKTIKSQLWEEAWCLTLPLYFPYCEASKIQKSIATYGYHLNFVIQNYMHCLHTVL